MNTKSILKPWNEWAPRPWSVHLCARHHCQTCCRWMRDEKIIARLYPEQRCEFHILNSIQSIHMYQHMRSSREHRLIFIPVDRETEDADCRAMSCENKDADECRCYPPDLNVPQWTYFDWTTMTMLEEIKWTIPTFRNHAPVIYFNYLRSSSIHKLQTQFNHVQSASPKVQPLLQSTGTSTALYWALEGDCEGM